MAGVVVATDSESESEYLQRNKGDLEIVSFKWTPEYEDKLEDILMKNYFDFHIAAKEFSRLVNGDLSLNSNDRKQIYQIDIKTI